MHSKFRWRFWPVGRLLMSVLLNRHHGLVSVDNTWSAPRSWFQFPLWFICLGFIKKIRLMRVISFRIRWHWLHCVSFKHGTLQEVKFDDLKTGPKLHSLTGQAALYKYAFTQNKRLILNCCLYHSNEDLCLLENESFYLAVKQISQCTD